MIVQLNSQPILFNKRKETGERGKGGNSQSTKTSKISDNSLEIYVLKSEI